MRISDWSSDVCSSDLEEPAPDLIPGLGAPLAERGCPVEAFADGCPATQARQAGLDRSLVPRVRLRPVLSQYVGQFLQRGVRLGFHPRKQKGDGIGRASCRARVCQYV